jgi:predicted nucleic acid-binding protein
MIVLDANYFLRYLTRPVTSQDQSMHQETRTFFGLVQAGTETFTTNDAVIAEVVFILSHPRHYGASRSDVVAGLKPLLTLTGCKMPRKRQVAVALDLWFATTSISFVDALAAVQSIALNVPLGTFDRNLSRVLGVTTWQPPAAPSQV